MKSQLIRNISVALLSAAYMFGQEPRRVTVQVPFGFHAGAATLPAGQYTVATELRSGLVKLSSADFKSNALVLSRAITPKTTSDEGKLIFNRYGNEYFLSRIWAYGVDGRELPKTKLEKESAANASRTLESVMARK